MTTAYWCLVAFIFFPNVLTMMAKSGGFDNNSPRLLSAELTGWRQRADWAQQNHFEAFPIFAAAVIVGHLINVAQPTLDMLAIGFIGFRVLHAMFYVMDKGALRSAAYLGGMVCAVSIFFLAP